MEYRYKVETMATPRNTMHVSGEILSGGRSAWVNSRQEAEEMAVEITKQSLSIPGDRFGQYVGVITEIEEVPDTEGILSELISSLLLENKLEDARPHLSPGMALVEIDGKEYTLSLQEKGA